MRDLAEAAEENLTPDQKTRLQKILGPKFPDMSAYELAQKLRSIGESGAEVINGYLETKPLFKEEVQRHLKSKYLFWN